MLTAQEARELNPDVTSELDRQLKIVESLIETAAKAGKDHIRLGDAFWSKAFAQPDAWKCAAFTLRNLGYKVEFHYDERQFVDTYTTVSW